MDICKIQTLKLKFPTRSMWRRLSITQRDPAVNRSTASIIKPDCLSDGLVFIDLNKNPTKCIQLLFSCPLFKTNSNSSPRWVVKSSVSVCAGLKRIVCVRTCVCSTEACGVYAQKGAHPYGSVFPLPSEGMKKREVEKGRESHLYSPRIYSHLPEQQQPPTHSTLNRWPPVSSQQTHTHTHPPLLSLNQVRTHTHTHWHKISFPTLSEMSRDPGCKMEWMKHMIRNREGSH